MEICRRTIEKVWNAKNYDAIPKLYAKDCVFHGGPGGDMTGLDAYEAYVKEVHTAFPDFEATEELCFCDTDENLVCMYLHYSGTHEGPFIGAEPTGKQGETTGIIINRVEDGKISEVWVEADMLRFMQEAGVLPDFGTAK